MNNTKELIKCTNHIFTLAEEVYQELGSGFKEDTLQQGLAIAFRGAKVNYLRETHIEIFFKKESLGLLRLDFLLPAQKHKKWELKSPVVIETKSISKINNDAHLQLKNYLLSLPKNDSKELKNIKDGMLLNWKNNLDPTDQGKNGTEIELFSFKNKRFKLLYSR
jgi:GxxExxY protein